MSDTPPKADPKTPSTPYECLKDEIDGYITYSYTWMRFWAFVYYVLRTALIVLAALVAAKDGLSWVAANASILAVAVAIGTSLDTWLKTGNRYHGHYLFNDKFISLNTDLELTLPTETVKIDDIHQRFTKLIDDYSAAVLPT
jgi:hypothetical protein